MTNTLSHSYAIVLVEDSIEDAEIITYELKKAGFAFTLDRVETEREYLSFLQKKKIDIVLSDYHLPQFSGKRALELLLEHAHDVPFILVSGAVGDEIAVDMLRSGCIDYVLKEKLTRLPSAVVRAIQEVRSKKEKRVALDALKESELRFRKIADNSPMLIWMSDIRKKVNYVNATWCQFTGRATEDVLGDGWTDDIHPDDLDRCVQIQSEAFDQRESFTLEYRLRYHDGTFRWIFSTGVPNYLPNGEMVGYIGSCIDITERKLAEEALRQSEERYSLTLKVVNDGIWDWNMTTQKSVASENYYAMLGYEPGEFDPTNDWIHLVHPDEKERVEREITDGLLLRGGFNVDARMRRKGGEWLWMAIRGRVVEKSSDGTPGRMVGTLSDITLRKQAEAVLMEERRRLAAVIEATNVATWEWNIESGSVIVNSRWAEMIGYTVEELSPITIDTWSNLVHPQDKIISEELLRKHFCGELDYYDCELRMRHKDGQWIWIHDRGKIVSRNADGTPFLMSGTHADISKRKQTEESLHHTTEMLDTFFNQSLDACYFMQLQRPIEWNDSSDKTALLAEVYDSASIIKLNHALLKQYNITEEELRQLHPREMFDEDFAKVERLFTQLFDSGATYYSTTMRRGDNQTEIVIEGNAVCMYDEQRRITGFFGIQRDVTDSVKEKEDLQRNQERYKKFFEEDMTGDFITKLDGIIVMCNQSFARIFGFSSVQETLQVNHATLFVNDQERQMWIQKIRTEKKIERYALQGRRANGEVFVMLMTAIAHCSPSGEIEEIVGYIIDDTRRQEMESQMIQAQKMESIGELASGVAHDFNNILNNIFGFSQQLVKYHRDPARVMRYTDTIAKSAQRGTEIASKLLSFARQRKTETGVISLGDIVGDVLQMCKETFMHSIEIESSVDDDLWKVQGDRSGLYQMLLNISMNARDAIVEQPSAEYGGLLKIEAKNQSVVNPHLHWFRNSPPSRCIEIVIKDNGVGIPQSVIDKIFDPFFSTKKQNQQKGTGLGLTVVYNIVKSHHGAIQVKSEEGKGTEFHIYLPAVEYSTPVAEGNTEYHYRSQKNELILLVDDEEGMLELGRELLEENGYRVMTASNGLDAISIFEKKKDEFALVILDLVMPGIDGGQTYLRLKKIKPDLRAFFCSGYVTDSLITNLLAEEQLSALQKPFRQEQFLKFVHSTLYSS